MTLELYSGDLPCKSKLVNCDHKSLCVSPTRLETTNRRSSLEIAIAIIVNAVRCTGTYDEP